MVYFSQNGKFSFSILFFTPKTLDYPARRYDTFSAYRRAASCSAFHLSTTPRTRGHPSGGRGLRPHGNFTPGRIAAGCSHCVRRLALFTLYARAVTEQEYHCPCRLLSPLREPSGFSDPYAAAHPHRRDIRNRNRLLQPPARDRRVPSAWLAMLITQHRQEST